jgi:hyperosmotically inducible protein
MKTIILAVLLFSIGAYSQPSTQQNTTNRDRSVLSQPGQERIIKEVHHELVMLPFYGVFDNLAYQVAPDGTVTLLGQVNRPALNSDA